MNPLLASIKAASLAHPLRRALNVQAKVIDEAQGTVEFVASDETLDCQREIVRVNGWRFTHFAKNAPFVDSHDYSTIKNILGQVTDWRIEKNQLIETVQYSREPGTLAEWAFKMVRDGFLKAVSVGFVPLSLASKWDGDTKDFLNEIASLGLDAQTAAQVCVIYRQQEQIELSQCILGANPNALAKAYKAGTLTEQDIDQFATLIENVKHAAPAADSADAGAASPRTRLAMLAMIQSHL